MKNFVLLFLIIFLINSCDWFMYTPQQCATSTFSFTDNNEIDLFDNSLSVEDFQVIDIKGTSIKTSSIVSNVHVFDVSFLREESYYNDYNDTVIVLFEIKGYTPDTVIVIIEENKKELFIKNLFYNNVLLENNENYAECGNWHKILK